MNTFQEACRENTGASAFDSGCAYGRHHEKPPLNPDCPLAVFDPTFETATIETASFLEEWSGGIDKALQARFEEWADLEENEGLSWFKAGEKFCQDVLRLAQVNRGNTCNQENDLSQDFVWEVWEDSKEYDSEGGIYASESTVTVFYMHTGCDIRSGYGRPIFVKPQTEYSIPVDLVVGYYLVEVLEEWTSPEAEVDLDCVSVGYSQNPTYELFSNLVEKHFEEESTNETAVVKLKDGRTVKLGLEVRTS